MRFYRALSVFTLSALSCFSLEAQIREKCVVYNGDNKGYGAPGHASFENWLRQAHAARTSATSAGDDKIPVYYIPVVVHVIHFGEHIGVDTNIPDAQIFEQMDILNKDFRRKNEDAVNTPDIFMEVAADTYIEFALARFDPEGKPTNGIVRVDSRQKKASAYHEYSYWPAEDYLNIWVTDLGAGLAGGAQYPIAPLPGLEASIGNRLSDGIKMHYQYFGKGFGTVATSRGRTLTHEMGHFLGLLHTWGNVPNGGNGCQLDDFCDDTPNSAGPSYGCTERTACNGPFRVMHENFMDYTDDDCMNMFTVNQVDRMRTVLEYSRRRLSLRSSPGLGEPEEPLMSPFSYYPNPAKGKVNLAFDIETYGEGDIEVINAMGATVFHSPLKNKYSAFETADWQPGVYLLRVRAKGFQKVRRLIVGQ